MNALALLQKNCKTKDYKNFGDLEIGEYLVEEFQFTAIKDKFKDDAEPKQIVKAVLEDCFVFLPERLTKNFTQEHIDEMNNQKIILIYKGKDGKKVNSR